MKVTNTSYRSTRQRILVENTLQMKVTNTNPNLKPETTMLKIPYK